MKNVHKSKENKVLTGTIGGLGEYLEVDPVILRVAWILVSVFTGLAPGILAYIFTSLVVPEAI